MKPTLTIDQHNGRSMVVTFNGEIYSSRLKPIIIEEDSMHGYLVFPEGMDYMGVPARLRNVILHYGKALKNDDNRGQSCQGSVITPSEPEAVNYISKPLRILNQSSEQNQKGGKRTK